MRGIRRKPLDGDDLVGGPHVPDADRAGALHRAVDVHGAGAALRDAAAVFRAGEADLLADHPQERGIRLDLHVVDFAVDVEFCHELPLASCVRRKSCDWAGRRDWSDWKISPWPLGKIADFA